MAEKLTVENFGPIKKAEIDVTDMMVFIGPQSSGKSTLAKLITILNDFNFRQSYNVTFKEELEKYNLKSFLKKTTFIQFESSFFSFKYKDGNIEKFDYRRILNHRINQEKHDKDDIASIRLILGLMIFIIIKDDKSDILIRELQKDDYFGFIDNPKRLTELNLQNSDDFKEIPDRILKLYEKKVDFFELKELAKLVTQVFSFIRPLDSLYIPAERTLIPLFQNNLPGLLQNKILISNYILQAIQEYINGLETIDNLDLSLIGDLRFKKIDNKSYIYHNHNQKIELNEASSGVQSIMPIMLLIESSIRKENYINLNYVVEEPELNLYPEAQYKLIKYLVRQCLETDTKVQSKNLIITTHSPYVLASINNLLYAHTKSSSSNVEVNNIINSKSWICPKNFNAYQVINGSVEQIFDKDECLIDSNIIDESSELIMEDFEKLALI